MIGNRFSWRTSKINTSLFSIPFSSLHLLKLTIKFCWRGDQEYIIGTEATALRVFSGMTCFGKSMSLVTEHWNKKLKLHLYSNVRKKNQTKINHRTLYNVQNSKSFSKLAISTFEKDIHFSRHNRKNGFSNRKEPQ